MIPNTLNKSLLSVKGLSTSFIILFFFACRSEVKEQKKDTLFKILSSAQTGIDFNNLVEDKEEMNIFNYHNFYNGGGVAIGDINNDNLPDVFFTSNQGENKLYLNKGNWKFIDQSVKAGILSKHKWHTGVTMADVNGDGWIDIYICNG